MSNCNSKDLWQSSLDKIPMYQMYFCYLQREVGYQLTCQLFVKFRQSLFVVVVNCANKQIFERIFFCMNDEGLFCSVFYFLYGCRGFVITCCGFVCQGNMTILVAIFVLQETTVNTGIL
eukprot:TRINITY_DN10032_c0_g1_i6.p3 TRINITY_DN10032_c0_g1~~TRINITY_DN10032_c0_g1_i6.p3  ORF type:complete len:119 (-),score=0.38 TRINITY_DN10032_c0_g1_i6:23-379(-)